MGITELLWLPFSLGATTVDPCMRSMKLAYFNFIFYYYACVKTRTWMFWLVSEQNMQSNYKNYFQPTKVIPKIYCCWDKFLEEEIF